MLREAVARAEDESEEDDSDSPPGGSDVGSADNEDCEEEEEEVEERDFFLDSAMRELDLEGPDAGADSNPRDSHACVMGAEGGGEGGGVEGEGGSDVSPAGKSRKNNTKGRAAASTQARRGVFDFGGSSSSSGSDSSNDSDGDESSGEQEGGGGGGASGGQEENSELREAMATASAAANKCGADGQVRAGAAAATSTRNVFHVKGDVGASVAGLVGDGLGAGEDKFAGRTGSVERRREAARERGERPGGGGGSVGSSDEADGCEGLQLGGRGGKSDEVERIEPTGKRGRVKGGRGKAVDVVAAEIEKGARRRRRQAIKAAKAAKGGHGKGSSSSSSRPDGGGGGEDGLGCRVCGKHFPSRSKLFAHVKAEGHALLA